MMITRHIRSGLRVAGTGAHLLQSLNHCSIHFDTSVGLTDTQVEIRQTARRFAETEFAPHVQQWDKDKTFPREALQSAAVLGFGGLNVSDAYGGSGLTRSDTMVVYEALGSVDVSTTAYLTLHNMCAWMIDTYGSEQQKQQYLPDLTSCTKFASYCLTEPDYGSDASNLTTRAVLNSEKTHYILNGTKAFISGGSMSDVYVVLARTGSADSGARGISAFIVDKASTGLSFGALEDKMGWRTQPTCNVILDDCLVPVGNLLGEVNHGFKIAMSGLNGSRINICAAGIGAAITCFDKAVDYVKNRKQFQRTLSQIQSVQFRVSEMYSSLYTARMMVQRAALRLDESADNGQHVMVQVAMAKRYATDVAWNVINDSMQLHGGYGYISDYGIERFARDTRVHQILGGTSEIMQLIVGRYALRD